MFNRNISQASSEHAPFQTQDFAHKRSHAFDEHETLPGAREVRIVLGSAFFTWLALALLTFRATDQSLFHMMSPVAPVANWCGAFGAHVSALLFVYSVQRRGVFFYTQGLLFHIAEITIDGSQLFALVQHSLPL